ncbi:MAG: hypothetical protein MZV63_26240 [Marinilabiliales bacterium]|nr:hypothetical protein [Marinilabiliales bacterium]
MGRVGELLSAEDIVFIQCNNQDELLTEFQHAEMVSKVKKEEDDLLVNLKKPYTASDLNKFCFEKRIYSFENYSLKKQSLEAQFLELVK